MAKVLGLGGIMFKSKDPEKLGEWYKKWLGIPVKGAYGAALPIADLPPNVKTAWAPFAADTTYFAPSTQAFMFNLVVDDLAGILKQIEEGGGTIIGEPEDSPYGKFGRFLDPEGNKVELWEVVR